MREKITINHLVWVALLLCLTPTLVSAQELTVVPSISAKGEYDSNPFFTFDDEDDDYFVTIRPGATLEYNTQLWRVESIGVIDIDRYAENSDLDEEKYRFELNTDYKFLPRWSASGIFSFIKDNTFDTQLLETGRVTEREDRRRYDVGGGLDYQLSELSDLGVEVVFTRKEYDGQGNDTDAFTTIATYSRQLKNQRDVVSAIPFYDYRDNDVAELNVIGLGLGWLHPFSETLRLNARAGVHYWDQNRKEDNDDNTGLGPVADLNLEKIGELFSGLIGYRRDIRTPTSGRFITVDRFYTRLNQRITERLSAAFAGYLYFSRDLEDSSENKSRYFQLTPSLIFRITENHDARLAYSYQNDYDDDIDSTRDRHRAWLWFNFYFPKKWNW